MTPERLHRALLGTVPSEQHERLYANYPRYRGFSSATTEEAAFEATFVLALVEANRDGKLSRSYLFVPANKSAWVEEQARAVAQRMFLKIKGQGDVELRKKVCATLGQSINQLFFGSRVLQMAHEPARWVAWGFRVEDPIPIWLREGLLPV